MMRHVDEVIQLSDVGLARAASGGWDQVYSLSNDLTSASIATAAGGRHPPVGYSLVNGTITPSNDAAHHWLEMAAFDRLKRLNTKSYQALMMAIIGAGGAALDRPALDIPGALREATAMSASRRAVPRQPSPQGCGQCRVRWALAEEDD